MRVEMKVREYSWAFSIMAFLMLTADDVGRAMSQQSTTAPNTTNTGSGPNDVNNTSTSRGHPTTTTTTEDPHPEEEEDSSSSSEDFTSGEKDYDSFSRSVEQELRLRIFNRLSYDKFIRPLGVVNVFLSVRLQRVNKLDIEEQTMALTAFFFVTWKDERLEWTNYSRADTPGVHLSRSIPDIFTGESYTWLPPINIENSVSDMSIISDPDVPMRVKHTGDVEWNPAGIYTVQCTCDVTFYPFDTQTCSLVISTSAYRVSEINLHFSKNPVRLQSYQENGEWELMNYTLEERRSVTEREKSDYSSLHVHFTMRRRPLYVFMNTILPTMLLSFLCALVFKLPPESGEKIGYSLTVLLAYAVYMTVISSNIPAAALSVSILSVYTVTVLVMGVIAVLLSIIVLECYHKDPDTEVSEMARKCYLGCLIMFSGWKRPGQHAGKVLRKSSVVPWDDKLKAIHDGHISVCDWDQQKLGQIGESETKESGDEMKPVTRIAWKDKNISWREFAQMLDRFFLRLYIFVLAIITALVGIMFSCGYSKTY
ncbi:acetylcholine receptor subunit alpha-1-A-like [Argopecten irradians]|uniref:acetylcholine receptor subunit alpha-1-A-like n=1 Tax=Argopecten irradians TaxID=31199 RepID=UPI003718ECF1